MSDGLVKISRLIISAFAALPLALCYATAAGAGVQLERGRQNHLVLKGKVNGHPASFLIDTGADVTFLRADRAKQFGISAAGGEHRLDNGKSFPVASAELGLGGLVLGNTRLALYEPSQLSGLVPGEKGGVADGIMGLDLLKGSKTIIDCHARKIFFQSAVAPNIAGFTKIPIREVGRSYLGIGANLRGKRGRLRIDTGAFVTVLNEPALLAAGISSRPSKLTAGGFGGRIRALTLAQIDDFKIGGVLIAPQQFAVMDIFGGRPPRKNLRLGFQWVHATERRDSGGEPFFGLLGNDLLDAHHAIIDLHSMSLFLR